MAISSEDLARGLTAGLDSSNTSSENKIDDRINFESFPFQVALTDNFQSKAEVYKYLTENFADENSISLFSNPTQFINQQVGNRETPAAFFGLDSDDFNGRSANDMLLAKNFQDTRVGGNDAYNCVWQFGPDDDIMHDIHTCDETAHIGLGRVYASTTQQNQIICWFSFGIPYFSKLASFYGSAFNTDLIKLNANGFSTDILLGTLFDAAALCISLPLLPVRIFNAMARPYDTRIGRFYELRSCMELYYKYVDSILAQWLVSVGLYNNGPNGEGVSYTADPEYIPDALRGCASIWDILRRRANNLMDSRKSISVSLATGIYGSDDGLGSETAIGRTPTILNHSVPAEGTEYAQASLTVDANPFEKAALEKLHEQQIAANADEADQTNMRKDASSVSTAMFDDRQGRWVDNLLSSAMGATQFIGFRIDNSTSANESFSNSTQPSAFATKFNEDVRSKQDEQLQSALNGGFGEGGVGKAVDALIQGSKEVFGAIGSALDSITNTNIFSSIGCASFTGAFIDIPDAYSSSDFGKSHSINLTLRSPYGDMMSIYQSIIVPLALVLAGVMPRAGGSNSYMQPFLFRAYCKGLFSIPMGIMESVSITRGSSEFGWTYNNMPSCVDVSISLRDMSPIMFMTLADDILINPLSENTSFKDYMLTLAGCGLWERISVLHRWKRNFQFTMHRIRNTWGNPAYWSHSLSQWGMVQAVTSIFPASTVPRNR